VTGGRHEFFVREAGPEAAPRVLLLHGWALDSLAAWHRVIPRLGVGVGVVAVDLRGHGKSDRIRGGLSVEDFADDVAAVLDSLGPGRYAVVGYSLGGMVAQALARRHPARACCCRTRPIRRISCYQAHWSAENPWPAGRRSST
jgi:pimeloyl-ACP methyl ester carboxylesterase